MTLSNVNVLNKDGDVVDSASGFDSDYEAEAWFDENYPTWLPGIYKMDLWRDDDEASGQ